MAGSRAQPLESGLAALVQCGSTLSEFRLAAHPASSNLSFSLGAWQGIGNAPIFQGSSKFGVASREGNAIPGWGWNTTRPAPHAHSPATECAARTRCSGPANTARALGNGLSENPKYRQSSILSGLSVIAPRAQCAVLCRSEVPKTC